MKSGERRRNIPPLKVDQSSPQNTELLLQQKLDSAEKEAGSLIKQLSALGFIPERMGQAAERVQRGRRRSPIAPRLSRDVDSMTLHKSYEALVTRVCKAESQIQTLKLNLCALQAEKDLYWTEAGDARGKLKEEIERGLKNEEKWKLDLEKVKKELSKALAEKQALQAEVRDIEESSFAQEMDQLTKVSSALEKDKLTNLRLTRKIEELTKELSHEVDLRQALEDSHNTVLQRIHDMEGIVERERTEMQRLVTLHKEVVDERERLKREKRHLDERSRALEESVRKLTKELGIRDAQLREVPRENQDGKTTKQHIDHLERYQAELVTRIKDLKKETASWKQKSQHLEDALKLAKEETEKMRLGHGEATQALIDKSVERNIAENDLLGQQLLEAKIEIDELTRDKHSLEAERSRLEERIGTMEEQQIVHQKVEASIADLMEGKDRLAYEKGQLQQRLDAMQREVEGSAKTRTENAHLRKARTSLETQLKKKNEELTSAELLVHQLRAQVRQEQNTSEMKERDFEIAIKARDGAIKEVESVNHKLDSIQHQRQIEVAGLQKSLADAQADHSKMAAMMDSVMSSYQNLQTNVESLQTQLGRKDRELAAIKQELQNKDMLAKHLQTQAGQREQQLKALQHAGTERVEVMQRELNTAKEKNQSLSQALEDLSGTNLQLQAALDGLQVELASLKQQKEQLEETKERDAMEASHQIGSLQEQLSSIQRQRTNQKSLVNKQIQKELATLRKTHAELTLRFGDLSRANTKLHQRIVDLEGDLAKSRDRVKSQKAQIDVLKSFKDKNAELSKENDSLKGNVEDFQVAKRAYVKRNREQTETIAAFVDQVQELQREIEVLAGKGHRDPAMSAPSRGKLEALEKKNAALKERLLDAEHKKSKLETKLAEVSAESEEVSRHLQDAPNWFQRKCADLPKELDEANRGQAVLKEVAVEQARERNDFPLSVSHPHGEVSLLDVVSTHLQDANNWFQMKYADLQKELVEANRGRAVLKEAVVEQARERSEEKLKSDQQTQRAYEIIKSSREALGRLAGEVERDHIESRSQMHFLARRVQAEKDHSVYVERKCNQLMDSSANCVEDLAIELDQTRTFLDSIR